MRPLYACASRPQLTDSGNLGLWHDKYYDRWERDGADIATAAPKKVEWIQSVVDHSRPRVSGGRSDLADESVMRLLRMVKAQGGRFWVFKTVSGFVTGLGQSHPIENGFAWQHLLGLPYIPGSSLKGAVKAWGQWSGQIEDEAERALTRIIWFDALPLGVPALFGDVMTPHYSPYYAIGSPPADDCAPVPIPYLTVAPGQSFVIAACGDARDLDSAANYLTLTLKWMGVGAKTSSAYGRLDRNLAREEELRSRVESERVLREKARRQAQLPWWEAEMEEDGYHRQPDVNHFMTAMAEKWIPRMENEVVEPTAQKAIARLLKQWYLEHRPTEWERPNKKNAEKRRRIEKVLQQE